MSGRAGSSGHQNLIRYASKKLLNEIIGDKYLSVVLIREQALNVTTNADIVGPRFGSMSVVRTEQRMYADIACAAIFDKNAQIYSGRETEKEIPWPEQIPIAEKFKAEGNMEKYREHIANAYGKMTYIIECEINPKSNLLRDGPKLTAYQLIKQKVPNFILILAVFEGTKIDHPHIFDEIWEFPRKTKKRQKTK
ncbi:unnamed protein product [marine sediment metagenome]|uniref:Uncharacterized protein n=1 Tax=marine sediment metagenome TaxID=412755 RepID=X1TZH9_9ZZZZ